MPDPDKGFLQSSAFTEAESLSAAAPYASAGLREPDGVATAGLPHATRFLPAACLAGDIAMLAAAAAIGLFWRGSSATAGTLAWSAAFAALALSLLALKGSYTFRLNLRWLDDVPSVVFATAISAMVVISARALLGSDHAAATESARYWLLSTVLVSAGRAGLLRAESRVRRRGEGARPTLIVGAGRIGRLTAKRLIDRPDLGLKPIGFLDRDPLELDDDSVHLPVLGASWDLERVVAEHGVQHVVVTFSTAPHQVLLSLMRRCTKLGISVSVLPRLFETEGRTASVERLGALPLLGVRSLNPNGLQFRVKYSLERVLAALGLLVTLPLLIAAAIGIRLTMGSPILFRQRRIGADGREFHMLKLRTMRGRPEEDGEADIDWALQQLASNGNRQKDGLDDTAPAKPGGDRLTMLGRGLRRFSLDELPQLWNVVRGDMSLVGPRPERVTYVRRFERSVYRYADRHRVKSGITGWAQVSGLRGRTSLSDRVEWDNYYIENWSPWLDVKIILMTVACVLRGQHEERYE